MLIQPATFAAEYAEGFALQCFIEKVLDLMLFFFQSLSNAWGETNGSPQTTYCSHALWHQN